MQSLSAPSDESAGRVVHDLNGLLSLALTHTELVRRRAAGRAVTADALAADLDQIAAVTEEAALYATLLAPPEPEPAEPAGLDLRTCLESIRPKVRRLLCGADLDTAGVAPVAVRGGRAGAERALLSMVLAARGGGSLSLTARSEPDGTVLIELVASGERAAAGGSDRLSDSHRALLEAAGVRAAGAGGSWSLRLPGAG